MYSPKIREDLIPRIYVAAKGAGLAMTTWVNLAVEQALAAHCRTEPNHQPQRKENAQYESRRP